MKFKLTEDIELYYSDLEFEVSDGNYDWSCGAYGSRTVCKDVTYSVDEGEVIEIILKLLERDDPILEYKLSKMSDEEFDAYFTTERLEEFIEKYEEEVYDHFADSAADYAAYSYDGD